MKIDQAGIDQIKSHEKYSATKYLDQAGIPTIGYGHTDDPDEWPEVCNREQAEMFLRRDIEVAEKAVNEFVKVPLTQNQYNAVVSFTFNEGATSLLNSTLLKLLNMRQYAAAANEFTRWDYCRDPKTHKEIESSGLLARREKEKELFNSPDIPITQLA